MEINKNIIFGMGMLWLLLILPTVIAETDTRIIDDVFPVNIPINYAKPCFNNGTYCSSSATCNYTIFYPNNSLLISNLQATNRFYDHNISFTPSVNGFSYKVDMTCIDGSLTGAETFYFGVTPSGKISSTGDSILYALFSVILFGVIFLITFFIFTMPSGNEKDDIGFENKVIKIKYIRMVFIAVDYVLIILLLNFLNALAVNFSQLSLFAGILGFIFETMLRLSWPFTIILIAWIIVMLVHDTNVNKQLKKIKNMRFIQD